MILDLAQARNFWDAQRRLELFPDYFLPARPFLLMIFLIYTDKPPFDWTKNPVKDVRRR